MTDEQYQSWLGMVEQAREIQGRIITAGGMATKSSVEDELMPLYGIDRGTAHDIMNHIEYHNMRPIYPVKVS